MNRQVNESYEDYKVRRTQENKAVKEYLRGRLIWYSSKQGTYRNKKLEIKEPIKL